MRGTADSARAGIDLAPRAAIGAVLALAVVVAAAGCSGVGGSGKAVGDPGEARPSRALTVPLPRDAASAAPSMSGTAVVAVAREAVGRFCRPTLTRRKWIGDLDPLLTLAAADAYSTVDPARVTCRSVTGSARLEAGDGLTQQMTFPTDGGLYRVTLTRPSLSDRWLVFRIAPVTAS